MGNNPYHNIRNQAGGTMAQDQVKDVYPDAEPVITVMIDQAGTVTSKVGGDKPVPSTYPSSSHPDGAIPYA